MVTKAASANQELDMQASTLLKCQYHYLDNYKLSRNRNYWSGNIVSMDLMENYPAPGSYNIEMIEQCKNKQTKTPKVIKESYIQVYVSNLNAVKFVTDITKDILKDIFKAVLKQKNKAALQMLELFPHRRNQRRKEDWECYI